MQTANTYRYIITLIGKILRRLNPMSCAVLIDNRRNIENMAHLY